MTVLIGRKIGIVVRQGLTILLLVLFSAAAFGDTCESVVRGINRGLKPRINEQELVTVLKTLNRTGNKSLPDKFVTKRQARIAGWRPGKNLWVFVALKGKSLGGDEFKNLEKRLPPAHWREADLGYHGGRRGPKRLIFSSEGKRMVTVDHYRTFIEVPACR